MKPAAGFRPAPARPQPDKQAQHIRLGETLDDMVAADMQDGDAGQRDGRIQGGATVKPVLLLR